MSQLSKRQFEVLTGAKSPFLPQEDLDKKGSAKGVKKGSKKGSERNKKVCLFAGDSFLIGVAISIA